MDVNIKTNRFTLDRAAYLRTMYTYNLWRSLGFLAVYLAATIAGAILLQGPSVGLGVAMGLLVIVPLLLVLRYFISRRNVYSPASHKLFDDPRTMTFSSSGYHIQTEGGVEAQMPWTHVVKAVQRGGFTLLFLGKIVHNIVPDSAFASSSDREAFRSLLKQQSFKTTPK